MMSSPNKRLEKGKRSKGERAIDRAIERFVKFQNEADAKYQKWEEEHWKKQAELDEKRRREEREHEI